jgi:molecular chaperone DnaK
VTIRVYQGEREMAADNKMLGQFDLVGIPAAPRGVPQIEVGFDIDANGIVNVTAKDKGTGKEQQIRIQASGGLSDDDIERMVKEAEENASADKAKRESVDARNQADSIIHTTEKSLADHGDKIDSGEKQAIEDAIAELKATLEDENASLDDINSQTETLAQASMKLGEAVYAAQQAEGAEAAASEGAEQASAGGADDDVVDADFEEVDDDKKNAS